MAFGKSRFRDLKGLKCFWVGFKARCRLGGSRRGFWKVVEFIEGWVRLSFLIGFQDSSERGH